MVDKGPDPSETCPRCHYFEFKERAGAGSERELVNAWPLGIDQVKAQDLLNKAFPQKQRPPR